MPVTLLPAPRIQNAIYTSEKVLPLIKPANYRQYLGNKIVCLCCPYFSGKYGAPPTSTRPPKCIDEDENGVCDIEEEDYDENDENAPVTPKNPVSVHNNCTYLFRKCGNT